MFRVFLELDLSVGQSFSLPQEEEKHLLQVLREKEGFVFSVVDINQRVFLAKIEQIKPTLLCEVVQALEEERNLPVEISIFQGLLKGEKWDFLLQKLTELGVKEIVPLMTEHSVVKWSAEDLEKKRSRFEKIIKAASMQSQRLEQPSLNPLKQVKDFIASKEDYDFIFACYEREELLSLKQFLEQKQFLDKVKERKSPLRLAFLVGAEGGLSVKEVEALEEAKIASVHLGKRILRAETAGLYVLSALGFYLEA